MPDASENAFRYVLRSFQGKEYKLGKLTPRDRQKILDRLKAERKEKLKENLKFAGIDPEGTLVELEKFDDSPWGDNRSGHTRWIDHVNTPAGHDEIVQVAWGKYNEGLFPFFEEMNNNELFRLMMDLTGLTPTTEAGKEGSLNPTEGAIPPMTPTASSADAA